MVKDFRGNDVQVGDTIVYAATHDRSSCLHEGVVTKIVHREYNTYADPAFEAWNKLPEYRKVTLSIEITKCMNDWLASIRPWHYEKGQRVSDTEKKTARASLREGRFIKVDS